MRSPLLETFYRLAASGWVPRHWLAGPAPLATPLPPRRDAFRLELVSHCWRYSWLLTYQLSSLVLHPPKGLHVTMTVCYSPEDELTREVLDFFETQNPRNVSWNWLPMKKEFLFRRAIGRDRAALATQADWIWFTDCDQVFHQGCLDALPTLLAEQRCVLAYPRRVFCTQLLDLNDPVFQVVADGPALVDIAPQRFEVVEHDRAVGALQILRGDVARQMGYCRDIKFYHEPLKHWQKTFEDRTFRWLLGTQGEPIELPGLYRIEHARKGRRSFGRGSSSLSGSVGATS